MAPGDVHERALRLLAARPRSRRELERRLVDAGFEAEEVVTELERLETVGLVDDEAFARAVAEDALGRRLEGRRGVARSLAARGIPGPLAAAVLEELGGDDEERAVQLARARAVRLRGVPVERAFPRLVAFLLRRGHEAEVARRAARRALGLDPDVEGGA